MAVPAALARACPTREATAADAVVGRSPRLVAEPRTIEEVAAVLRAAADAGLVVLPRGTGARLHWGAPPRACDLVVDLAGLDRLLDHAAGDMVVQAQAGVRTDRLAATVAQAGQQLAVDLPRYDEDTPATGTVGGLVATAPAGPRQLRYGGLRDLLLGVTMVRADGVVASSGGRVVKNVAGYDLGKLLCGSYGTLGLIVAVTLRLHPRPAATGYLTVTVPDPAAAGRVAGEVLGGQLAPSAVELSWPGPGSAVAVAVQFEGTTDGVAHRTAAAAELVAGAVTEAPPDWFGRWPGGPAGTLVAVRAVPAALAEVLRLVGRAGEAAGLPTPVRGSAGGALLQVGLPATAPPAAVTTFLAELRAGLAAHAGSAVVVHSPVADSLDVWGPVDAGVLALMRRVKEQFDPGQRLAPGRFVGGI